MTETVFNIVFANVMPYLAPIVIILCAFIVADNFISLIQNAFLHNKDDKRRDDY